VFVDINRKYKVVVCYVIKEKEMEGVGGGGGGR